MLNLNKLIDAADFLDIDFIKIYRDEIKEDYKLHRKPWEFTMLTYGLSKLGMLKEDKIGLGLGAGTERIIFYFANKVKRIYATDLYDPDSEWPESRFSLEEAYNQSPFPYKRENLEIKYMDMRKIDFPDNYFDFIWSASSIEHVDTKQELINIFLNVERKLKPGGILAITTEFNLTKIPCYEKNFICMDKNLLGEIKSKVKKLKLVEKIDYNVKDLAANEPVSIDCHEPHIVIKTKDTVYTSISLFFRKKQIRFQFRQNSGIGY